MVVLGLGNPTCKYEHTRHNAGFDVLDKVAAFFQVKLKKRFFCKYRYANVPGGLVVEPLTYMNNSGKIIGFLKKHINSVSDVVVVCDNMDLAVGGLRIKQGGAASGQKGLNSIAEHLGSNNFIRVYVGIGRPEPGVSVVDHVLGIEENQEKKQAYQCSLDDAANAVKCLLEGKDVEVVQREFNRKGIL